MTKSEFQQLQFEMEHTQDANNLLTKLLQKENRCYDVSMKKIWQKDTDKDGEFYFYTWRFSWKMLAPDGIEHECFNCLCYDLI